MRYIDFVSTPDEAGALAADGIRQGLDGAVIVRVPDGDLISFYGKRCETVRVTPQEAAIPLGVKSVLLPKETEEKLQLLYVSALLLYAGGGAQNILEAADRMRVIFRKRRP